VRLDHLLSKEHHEEHSNSWGVGRDGIVRCSGAGRVHNNNSSDWKSGAAGTLLGPEATPLVPGGIQVGVVPPFWWWGVVFGNWIVVASILSKIADSAFLFEFVFLCCKCFRAHGGCLGIRSR